MDWREYIRRPNPVAAALMTRMKIAPDDRPRVKLECLRMLVTLKLDKAKAALVGTFMESYLKLTTAENAVYNRELRKIDPQEQEAVMQFPNPWVEEGRALGRQEGRQEGRQDLILRVLKHRLGALPMELVERIGALSDSQMERFSEAFLDFQNLADVTDWIACHA